MPPQGAAPHLQSPACALHTARATGTKGSGAAWGRWPAGACTWLGRPGRRTACTATWPCAGTRSSRCARRSCSLPACREDPGQVGQRHSSSPRTMAPAAGSGVTCGKVGQRRQRRLHLGGAAWLLTCKPTQTCSRGCLQGRGQRSLWVHVCQVNPRLTHSQLRPTSTSKLHTDVPECADEVHSVQAKQACHVRRFNFACWGPPFALGSPVHCVRIANWHAPAFAHAPSQTRQVQDTSNGHSRSVGASCDTQEGWQLIHQRG